MKNIQSTLELLESRNLLAGAEAEINTPEILTPNAETFTPDSQPNDNEIPETFFSTVDDSDSDDAKSALTVVFQSLGWEGDTTRIKYALNYASGMIESIAELCGALGKTSTVLQVANPTGFSQKSWGVTLNAAGEILHQIGNGLNEFNSRIPLEIESRV